MPGFGITNIIVMDIIVFYNIYYFMINMCIFIYNLFIFFAVVPRWSILSYIYIFRFVEELFKIIFLNLDRIMNSNHENITCEYIYLAAESDIFVLKLFLICLIMW